MLLIIISLLFHLLFCLVAFVSSANAEHWENYTCSQRDANSIVIDKDTLWIGSYGGGVAKYLLNGTLLALYNRADGLESNYTWAVAIDKNGNKWFGGAYGVSKFDGTNWTTYFVSDSVLKASVWVLAVDSLNNLWCGTDGKGVWKFDGVTWTEYNTSNSNIGDNTIREITVAANHNVWIGGPNYGGVSKFDGVTWTTYTTANSGIKANECWAITEDAQHNMWFGADSWGGVSMFDGSSWTIYNNSNSPLSSCCMVTAIAVDLQGNKWFANGKVFKYDGVNWVTYDDNNSPVTGWISRIRVDRFGNKWFASGSGVLKIDMAGNWSVYDTTNYGLGHPYLSVYSIGDET